MDVFLVPTLMVDDAPRNRSPSILRLNPPYVGLLRKAMGVLLPPLDLLLVGVPDLLVDLLKLCFLLARHLLLFLLAYLPLQSLLILLFEVLLNDSVDA